MATWVEDVIQALNNLGGQAPLQNIYAEVKKIRAKPLTKTWHATIRRTLQDHSRDSEGFKGIEYFQKLHKGVWALSNKAGTTRPRRKTTLPQKRKVTKNYPLTDTNDTISNLLKTIKEYREFYQPDSPKWENYILDFFHLMEFKTKFLDSRLMLLSLTGQKYLPVCIACLPRPGEDFQEIVPGLEWARYTFFAAKFHQVPWGIITNGLSLVVIDCRLAVYQTNLSSLKFDEIIINSQTDQFLAIYSEFSKIKISAGQKINKHSQKENLRSESIRRGQAKDAKSLVSRSSKYSPLAEWLHSQPGKNTRVRLTFSDVENILGTDLPLSAYDHREFWANDSVGHIHSKLWLEAGWRTTNVHMTNKEVTFARIKEREQAYIAFWSDVLENIKKIENIKIRNVSPDGSSWVDLISLPLNSKKKSSISLSFTLKRQFRMELYIDTGNKEENKKIFDKLYNNQNEIENLIGQEISWERLDNRRASRIAIYTSGHIMADQVDLQNLILWIRNLIVPFYNSLSPLIK